jgi:hypothetical protein
MSSRRRTFLRYGCAFSLAVAVMAAPVALSRHGLGTATAQAATAKKPVKSKGKAKPAAKAKATKGGKKAKAKGPSKAAAAKTAVKTGRAALTQRELLDDTQFAPGLIDTAGSKTPVELLSEYKTTANEGDLESAAVLLRLASGEPLNHALVVATNDLIGVSLDSEDTAGLVELDRSPRTQMVIGVVKSSTAAADPQPSERISAAHTAVAATLPSSALNCLSAYKLAAGQGDAQSAAFALACANRQPVDEADVAKANALLGVASPVPPARLVALASGAALPQR